MVTKTQFSSSGQTWDICNTSHENIEHTACTMEVDSKQCLDLMWAHMQINVGKMNKVKSSHFNTIRKSYKWGWVQSKN